MKKASRDIVVITAMGKTLFINDETAGRFNEMLKTNLEYVSSP
jgi:hypothetical protein